MSVMTYMMTNMMTNMCPVWRRDDGSYCGPCYGGGDGYVDVHVGVHVDARRGTLLDFS